MPCPGTLVSEQGQPGTLHTPLLRSGCALRLFSLSFYPSNTGTSSLKSLVLVTQEIALQEILVLQEINGLL